MACEGTYLPYNRSKAKEIENRDLHKVNIGHRGSTVVKVLCYNSEGRWFDPS